MESNNYKIGDRLVFIGDSDRFIQNNIYTINDIYAIDYFIDDIDPNFGKEIIIFEGTNKSIYISDLSKQFTKIEDMRNLKLNELV